ENGIGDRGIGHTVVGGYRGRHSEDNHGRAAWIVWIQVQEAAGVKGVVVDHDDAMVDRRNPVRPGETISLPRLSRRKPQRIECLDVLLRRLKGVWRRQVAGA